MIQLNKEKKLDFSARVIVEGRKRDIFRTLDRKNFITKVEKIPDLTARYEAMQTLDCLITGKRVEVKNGKINLYSSNQSFRPVWTITNNPELISLLEELVR